MSFTPIRFVYTPPKTVPAPAVPAAAPAAPSSAASQSLSPETRAQASRAAALLGRLTDLEAANAYLTSALRAAAAPTSLALQPAGDPELAAALTRLYGSAPPAISTEMYYHLVQLEAGLTRTDMALTGTGSRLEASSSQRADVLAVTTTVEAALADTSEFRHQLPLLLRERAADSLVHDSLAGMLRAYPVLTGSSLAPPATSVAPLSVSYANQQSASVFTDFSELGSSLGALAVQGALLSPEEAQVGSYLQIDVSESLADALHLRLDTQERIYGATLNLLTATDQTIVNTTDLIKSLLTLTVDAVLVLQSMFLTLKAMVFKTKLKDLKNALTGFLMARAVAEVTLFTGVLDRLIQRAASPVEDFLRQAGGDFTKISHDLSLLATLVSPDGLTKAVSNQIHGTHLEAKPITFPALDQVAAGVRKAAGYVAWGQKEAQKKADLLKTSLTQAYDRQQQAAGARLDFLKSLQEIDANVSFLRNLILQIQQVARRNPAAPLEAALSSGQWASQPSGSSGASGQGASFNLQAALPTPSAAVAALLGKGGATHIPV